MTFPIIHQPTLCALRRQPAVRSLLCLCCLLGGGILAQPLENTNERLQAMVNELWQHAVTTYWSERTGLFYTRPPAKLPPAGVYISEAQYRRGEYRTAPYKKGDENSVGYNLHGGGTGTEDCCLFTGPLLAAMCDQYAITGDRAARAEALRAFKGLKCAATAHGCPGFIARGVCHEDGKSIFAGTSRDQYTNAIYGLWRFYHSDLAEESERQDIRAILCAVADKMTREVTPENNWSFDFAYGVKDDRGVGKMYEKEHLLTLRLAMFYAAAWDVSGKQDYHDRYRAALPDSLAGAKAFTEQPPEKIKWSSPPYTVLQNNEAFRLIYDVEKDPTQKAAILDAMALYTVYVAASPHFAPAKYKSPRDHGEIIGGLLLCPTYVMPVENAAILQDDIRKLWPKGWAGSIFTIIPAYWQARIRGYFATATPPSNGGRQ
ncbi:MAG: hypothetical protein ACOX9E_15680 [Lentisphaeria bacterium]|jgi:hypothetical protein